jgi:tetratricopeptide (TPR) repeat protein
MARPLRLASLAAVILTLAACGGRAAPETAAAQLGFGVRMAERGLWSEALFRFQQAERISGGNDAEVLNNLAVASEALGRFDDALRLYREALALAPGDRDLKANYDRFVSFYESFRARGEEPPPVAAEPEPAADSGAPGPATAPGPDAPLVPGGGEPPQPPTPPQPSDAADPPPPGRSSNAAGGHPAAGVHP